MSTHAAPLTEATYARRLRRVRSPAGIEAWLIEDHTLPILTTTFGFHGGASLDPAGGAGTARMLGSLLTEGAGPLDGIAFQEALGDTAIRLGISAGFDNIQGNLRCLARDGERAFTLLGLAVREPTLDPGAVERVRNVVLDQIRASSGRPDQIARQAFLREGFAGHAYGRPVQGDLDSAERITRADLRGAHAMLLTRGNLRVAVVGAITPEALGPLLDHAFAALPERASEPLARATVGALGGRIVTRLDTPQSAIVFGRPALGRDDPDFAGAVIVNYCLGGGGLTSRLFRELREKRGLCYTVGSQMNLLRGASTLIGSTRTGNDRVPEMIEHLQSEIRRLAADGLEAAEFEGAKSYLVGSHAMSLASSAALAHVLLTLQLDGRDVAWLDEWPDRIAAVSAADAMRAAGRLLGDGAMLLSVAGDPIGLPDASAA